MDVDDNITNGNIILPNLMLPSFYFRYINGKLKLNL